MEQEYRKNRIKSRISWVVATILAVFAAVVAITPFIFMVMNSFKEKFEMLTKGVFALPEKLNFANYQDKCNIFLFTCFGYIYEKMCCIWN